MFQDFPTETWHPESSTVYEVASPDVLQASVIVLLSAKQDEAIKEGLNKRGISVVSSSHAIQANRQKSKSGTIYFVFILLLVLISIIIFQ